MGIFSYCIWNSNDNNDNNDAANYLIENIGKIEFTDKFKNNIISSISNETFDITADIFKNKNPKLFNFLMSRDFKLSNSDDVNALFHMQ